MKSLSGGASAMAALMLLLLLLAPTSEAALQCSDVVSDLSPCLSYLKSGTGKPSVPCCSGASKLNAAASTTADRRTACSCMKSTAQKLNINAGTAQSLAGNCRINLPFAVSPNTDCSTIG